MYIVVPLVCDGACSGSALGGGVVAATEPLLGITLAGAVYCIAEFRDLLHDGWGTLYMCNCNCVS